MDRRLPVFEGTAEGARRHAVHELEAFVPRGRSGRHVPGPGAELPGLERELEPLVLQSVVHHAPDPRVRGRQMPTCLDAPIVMDAGGRCQPSAVRCTGAVTEPVRRRPFRGWLRSLRRSRDLVLAPDLPEGDVARLVKAIDDVLDQRETNSQRAAAERVVGAYSRLDPAGRRRFLETLATEFGADQVTLDRAVDRSAPPGTRRSGPAPSGRCGGRWYPATRPGCTSSPVCRTAWPSWSSSAPTCSPCASQDPVLGMLDDELTGHLSTLFDVGLLGLRQITWDSPASVLERLMATEAVHAIAGWDDLRHRLDGDQRCYAFFHPALPNTNRSCSSRSHSRRGSPTTCPNCSTAPRRSTTPTPRSSTRSRPRSRASPACTSATSSSSRSSTSSATRTTTSRRSRRCHRCPVFARGCVRRSRSMRSLRRRRNRSVPTPRRSSTLTDRAWLDDPTRAEKLRPGCCRRARATSRPRATAGASIRSPTSTSPTARRSSG